VSRIRAFTAPSSKMPAAAMLFVRLLDRLQHDHLQLIGPDGSYLMFGDIRQPPAATLKINDWRACERILRAGDIGFAESYAQGWIEANDLTAVLRLALRNEAVLGRIFVGARLAKLWYRLRHWLRPNTRQGSRRNIHAHYDIGNDFYRLWLDPGWTYSSALFAGDYSQSLQQAQTRKYQRIIEQLGLHAGDRVLEIGCGWGGFALHAAALGIDVDGVTISPSQLSIAQQRIAAHKLGHLANLRLCDYRDLEGEYDAIVSIEMFEAVGERYWPQFFQTLARHLKPGGKALVQSITIAERHFARYRSSTDFIQQYIFPGGMLPSPPRFCAQALKAGLHTVDQYFFGHDYAETLRRWHAACQRECEAISRQGFDERFMRIWRLYLAYCEAGFDEGRTDVAQFLLHKA